MKQNTVDACWNYTGTPIVISSDLIDSFILVMWVRMLFSFV